MYWLCEALGHNSPDYIHILVEAVRLAVTDALRYLGDPNHATLPVETLLDKSYSHKRAQHITMDRFVILCVCVVGTSVYQPCSVDFR